MKKTPLQAKFEVIQKRIENLADIAKNAIFEELKKQEPFLVAQNRKQVFEGKYSNEAMIAPEYKPSTKRKKARKGQPYDRVTLRDKGSFYGSFKADVSTNKSEINYYATDSKTKLLASKYTSKTKGEIFGISDKNKAALMLITKPLASKRLFNQIFR